MIASSDRRRHERRLVSLEDTHSWSNGRALTLEEAEHLVRTRAYPNLPANRCPFGI